MSNIADIRMESTLTMESQTMGNDDCSKSSSTTPSTSTLNATTASLQRLDDKLATGMSITDVAKARWLTTLEVLEYLDQAGASGAGTVDTTSGTVGPFSMPKLPICTAAPKTFSEPPTSGMLLLFNSVQTPDYADDGIDWIREKGILGEGKWRNIDGVLESSTSESGAASLDGRCDGSKGDACGGSGGSQSESNSNSAMQEGATVTYLTSESRPTFHRREYRGPNDIVLLHYLDSIRALRVTTELVDRLVMLSAGGISTSNGTTFNSSAGVDSTDMDTVPMDNKKQHVRKKTSDRATLDDTMSILYTMIDEHNAAGTSSGEATDKHFMNAANDAALSSVMKHISPDEARRTVDAMESAMEVAMEEEASRVDIGDVADITELDGIGGDINDVTDLDINEAIDQVLTGGDAVGGVPSSLGAEIDAAVDGAFSDIDDVMDNMPSDAEGATPRGAAALIEDRILNAMEGVLTDELRLKLIKTTETMLNVAGVQFNKPSTIESAGRSSSRGEASAFGSGGVEKIGERVTIASPFAHPAPPSVAEDSASVGSGQTGSTITSREGTALPEIVDVTPDFHVVGHSPPEGRRRSGSGSSSAGGAMEITGSVGDLGVMGQGSDDFQRKASQSKHSKSSKSSKSSSIKSSKKNHVPSVVISSATPLPGLPPYVDPFLQWEQFAAFVDFVEVQPDHIEAVVGVGCEKAGVGITKTRNNKAEKDPSVRNVSFQKLTPITPYSYKCPIPSDIDPATLTTRNIVIVGILLPKDSRVPRNMVGLELALKLCIQTEWSAAADLVSVILKTEVVEDVRPLVSGIRRPLLIVPCGGSRMQLLSQISDIEFTIHPRPRLSRADGAASHLRDNSASGMVIHSRQPQTQIADEKRKREEYLDEWASMPGNDRTMSYAEVDRHRKIRFVERISNAITGTKEERDLMAPQDPKLSLDEGFVFDGEGVDNMNDEEINALLGRVLLRFIEKTIENSKSEEETRREINFCGYSGLSILHHASFHNFGPLASLLLSRGADPNIQSSAGGLTPLHFAAAAGHEEMVALLLQSGCNPSPVDFDNMTPAEHAMRTGHPQVANALALHIQQAGMVPPSLADKADMNGSIDAIDGVLQSAFKELSLKDKLGLNLFATRTAKIPNDNFGTFSEQGMMTDGEDNIFESNAFGFISEEDREKLKAAMSLASEMDLEEMNRNAKQLNVRKFLRQSNYEAIKAASRELAKSDKKESDILERVRNSDDPSKMQLSRALAMLVLRKNLPS